MISVSRGRDSLVVTPEHGGAILGWTRAATHLLRHPGPEAVLLGHPGAMGCFPLVPYCNRIAHRRFTWLGRAYELAANFGDHPHAIHGIGWQRAWQVENVAPGTVTLSLRHDPSGEAAQYWPFAFDATLTYRLTDHGLSIEMAAVNRHSAAAPLGIGAHPYFPRGPGDGIAFEAGGVWVNRGDLPINHGAIPGAWDHRAGRLVDQAPLDNCFTEWRGEARLPFVHIAADPVFSNLQVYTPPDAAFFCVEPVTHGPDAINRPGQAGGTHTVSPGQTLSGSITFTPRGA